MTYFVRRTRLPLSYLAAVYSRHWSELHRQASVANTCQPAVTIDVDFVTTSHTFQQRYSAINVFSFVKF